MARVAQVTRPILPGLPGLPSLPPCQLLGPALGEALCSASTGQAVFKSMIPHGGEQECEIEMDILHGVACSDALGLRMVKWSGVGNS